MAAIAEKITASGTAKPGVSLNRDQTSMALETTISPNPGTIRLNDEALSESLGRTAHAIRMVRGYSRTESNNAGARTALKIPPRTPPTAKQR